MTALSLETAAYNEIRKALIMGDFPPGYQIVEEHIAKQLEMSRSPVRSALKRLQTEGFLEKRENKRIYVSMPTTQQTVDLLYIRESLDGTLAKLAAQRRTEKDIAQIRHALRLSETTMNQPNIFTHYNETILIHYMIYQSVHNDTLYQMAKRTQEQISLFTMKSFQTDRARLEEAYKEHIQICEAVINGDCDLAESSARTHVHNMINRVRLIDESRHRVSDCFGYSSSRLQP